MQFTMCKLLTKAIEKQNKIFSYDYIYTAFFSIKMYSSMGHFQELLNTPLKIFSLPGALRRVWGYNEYTTCMYKFFL